MKCENKRCRGHTTPAGHSPKCGKCRSRQWKERNPCGSAFAKLRNRAKERGHEFTLTFEEFKKFAEDSGWMKHKGKTAQSLSINRIDHSRGYHADNIEALTLSVNSRLGYAPIPEWYKQQIINGTTPPPIHQRPVKL